MRYNRYMKKIFNADICENNLLSFKQIGEGNEHIWKSDIDGTLFYVSLSDGTYRTVKTKLAIRTLLRFRHRAFVSFQVFRRIVYKTIKIPLPLPNWLGPY